MLQWTAFIWTFLKRMPPNSSFQSGTNNGAGGDLFILSDFCVFSCSLEAALPSL